MLQNARRAGFGYFGAFAVTLAAAGGTVCASIPRAVELATHFATQSLSHPSRTGRSFPRAEHGARPPPSTSIETVTSGCLKDAAETVAPAVPRLRFSNSTHPAPIRTTSTTVPRKASPPTRWAMCTVLKSPARD
jgi:hypothetical protein